MDRIRVIIDKYFNYYIGYGEDTSLQENHEIKTNF